MTYAEAEEELYQHERPYYSYCASGFPMRFADLQYQRDWAAKRKILLARVERLRPESASERHIRLNRNPKLWAVSDGR